MSETNVNVLGAEIKNIKEDIQEFKDEVRTHLKEVKETHKVYADTQIIMRENMVKVTTLIEKQDERLNNMEQDLKKARESENSNITFLQNMVQQSWKWLGVIILALLGFKDQIKSLF